MRVNGFRGGRLPPKGQIQQIRFRRNMFAADTHEPGFVSVDITTKPGLDNWRGATNVGFRDSALNARNAFAPVKGDEQHERYGFKLNGPLWKQHTSLSLSVDGIDAFDTKTIVAALPSGYFADSIRKPNDALNVTARLEHALTKSQMLRAEAAAQPHDRPTISASATSTSPSAATARRGPRTCCARRSAGAIRKALYNELRAAMALGTTSPYAPTSTAPAVLVLNAFDTGGAQIGGSRASHDCHAHGRSRHRDRASRDPRPACSSTPAATARTSSRNARRHVHVLRPRRLRRRRADYVHAQRRRPARVRPDAGAIGALRAGRFPRAQGSDAQRRRPAGNPVAHRRLPHRAARRHRRGRRSRAAKRRCAAARASSSTGSTRRPTSRAFSSTARTSRSKPSCSPDIRTPGAGDAAQRLPPGRVQLAENLKQPELREAMAGVEQTAAAATCALQRDVYPPSAASNILRAVNINAPGADGRRPDPLSGPIGQIDSVGLVTLRRAQPELQFHEARTGVSSSRRTTPSRRSIDETDSALTLPADRFESGGRAWTVDHQRAAPFHEHLQHAARRPLPAGDVAAACSRRCPTTSPQATTTTATP